MKLKVTQCEVGKFNLAGNEKTLSFYMGIYEDNKIVSVDGISAMLHYSGDEDELNEFEDAFGNLEHIFSKCFKYADRVWSSTNYKARCLLFAKVFNENYEAINAEMVEDRKRQIEKEIASLQKELSSVDEIVPSLYYTTNKCLNEKIKTIERWIEANKVKLLDMINGSESYLKLTAENDKYSLQIADLSSNLLTSQTETC